MAQLKTTAASSADALSNEGDKHRSAGEITGQAPPPESEAAFWVCYLLPCRPVKARNILHSQNVSRSWMKVPTLVQHLQQLDLTAAPESILHSEIEEFSLTGSCVQWGLNVWAPKVEHLY